MEGNEVWSISLDELLEAFNNVILDQELIIMDRTWVADNVKGQERRNAKMGDNT